MLFFKDTDKELSDKRIESIIKSIETRDASALIELFSVNAKRDSSDFDKQISDFFSIFHDNNFTIEENSGPIVYNETDNGEKTKKMINWYEIHGQKDYTIYFIEWIEDTRCKENIGLYTLRIIENKDYDEQFIGDDEMEIAGIYYNPT